MDASLTLEGYDQELMASFQALGPLLLQSREYKRAEEEERDTKRLKPMVPQSPVKQEESADGQAALGALQLLAQLAISHDRQLQQLAKQDSYVLFIGNNAQGALPMLATLAGEWKKQINSTPEVAQKQTLRTYLFQGMVKELLQRATKLSKCSAEDTLWTTAIQKGTLKPDGSWPYQKWDPQTKRLVEAAKTPLTMARLLKELQFLEELLVDSHHIIRFHALRPQMDMTPWQLQINLRDDEVWRIMGLLTNSTVWVLLGMQVKCHNQQLSKPAAMLQDWLNKATPQKGRGKGHKGKHKSQR